MATRVSSFLLSAPLYVQERTGYSWKTLALVLICSAICSASFIRNSKLKGSLPPGPPGLPFVGNLLQIPSDRAWLVFTEWKKQYGRYLIIRSGLFSNSRVSGPLFYINIAGQHTVVLGNHKVAADLLDRRASLYSDRARNIVAGELLTGGMVFAFAQHNDIWKRQRRGSHE